MSRLKKIVSFSIILTLLAKVSGFLRDLALSYFYGISAISDAYIIAYTLPLLIVGLIGEAIRTGFLPIFSEISEKYHEKIALQFSRKLISILIVFTTIIVFTFLFFNELFISLLFPGLNNDTFQYAVSFTAITIWGIYFLFIVEILTGIAQFHHRFLKISLISLPMNTVMIIALLFSEKFSLTLLPLSILLGIFSQLFLFRKEIYMILNNFKLSFDFQDKYIKKIIALSLPVLLGISAHQINNIVDMNMASLIQNGGIAVINYSNRINTLFHGVVALTIASIAYPILARLAVQKNFVNINKILNEVLKVLTIICLPATILIMFYSEEIISLLYQRGSFNYEDVVLTAKVLKYYVLAILPIAFREILVRVYYSFNNTKIPVYTSLVSVIINIFLNIILSYYFGLPGLALASSLAAMVSAVLLLLKFKSKEINFTFNFKELLSNVTRTFLATLVSFSFMLLIFFNLEINKNLSIFISLIIFSVLYFVTLLLFKVFKISNIKFKN